MSYGLYLSAAGMKVSDHKQALLANNMANANTTGFKQDLATVRQRLIESRENGSGFGTSHPVLDDLAGGLNVQSSFHDFSQGPIEYTNRPLDVAIHGEGFFAVENGNQTRYTRDGQFTINTAGELVLAVGQGRWRVLDDSGSRIVPDPVAEPPVISQDGTIRQGRTVLAKLGVVTTDDKQSLRKEGANLYDAGDLEMTQINVKLATKSTEGSNVDPMHGLATMIEATRAYQLNSRLIEMQDRMTDEAITTIGRAAG